MAPPHTTRRSRGALGALALALLAAALLSFAPAFTSGATPQSRRDVLSSMGLVAAPAAVAGLSLGVEEVQAIGPPWAGRYSDPQHPNCKRLISEVTLNGMRVDGRDGKPGCGEGVKAEVWAIRAAFKEQGSNEALFDFSFKGGPKDVVGKWDGSGIVFPDGNKWTKMK
mmetsp:Transcript_15471/g.34068  ORF Transcript_15471/g.34068 Transcript_15471/m.34068 type:complete len:168 (-) Transcript_15471:75-578(-)|eukprot:CAMPEP_0170620374 /NCGR_PEP_ID=MMETSP0224-20130122/28024_1 /TAXON_ID=285029 /ORGANISM="Togula jolla, Strain CCCM 725" /LENGTH=167 /DNA_ID=CAMNT_0010946543 /DNA_START=45 /DNA_END=548 /DNA_ORIENTATION=-